MRARFLVLALVLATLLAPDRPIGAQGESATPPTRQFTLLPLKVMLTEAGADPGYQIVSVDLAIRNDGHAPESPGLLEGSATIAIKEGRSYSTSVSLVDARDPSTTVAAPPSSVLLPSGLVLFGMDDFIIMRATG